MSIRVVCPHCETAFNVADELRGKKVRCRECEKPVPVVATKSRPRDDEDDEREERVQTKPSKPAAAPVRRSRDDDDEKPSRNIRRRDDDDDDDDDDDRPVARKGKKKSTSTGVIFAAVGGGVVLLAAIIGVVIWLVMKDSDKTAENTPAPAPAGFPGGGAQGGPPAGMMMGGGQGNMMGGGQGGRPGGGMMGADGGMAGADGGMMGKGRPGLAGPGEMPNLREIDQSKVIAARALEPAVRKKIEDSTVYIEVKDKEKNPTFAASGSGFLAFEPGIVLTNAHVVDMLEPGSDEPESITVVIHSGLENQIDRKGKVLAVDQRADLAVVRIDPAGLPPPLVVKSSTGLQLTQPVYVCGFPRGKQISKTVTIFQGQVASLSRDPKTNVLDRVVLTSEMQHGNSGGPVVNDTGEVVGVNVAGYEGTRINMAVPGDYVHVIINGRITRMRTGQSSFSAGQVTVPLVADIINPMGRLNRVEVDVWMGEDTPNYSPPGSRNNPPAPRTGDSQHIRSDLELNTDKATGEFKLPDPAPGKAYYWQPILTYKEKGKPDLVLWSIGEKYQPDQPVYRRPAKLLHKKSTGNRNVSVGIKEKFSLLIDKAEESLITVQFDGELTEQLGAPDAQGKSMMRVNVHTMRPEVRFPDDIKKRIKELETLEKERQRVFQSVGHLDLRMTITERGDVESPVASAKSAPPEIRAEVESIGEDILQWLQAASIPLPNRQMAYAETWSAKRPFAVLTPMTDLHFASIDMTYTYLGVRTRENREEALVDISGKLRNKQTGQRFGCRLDGRVLVDLETGLVTLARTTTSMDLDLPIGRGQRIPARGSMEVNFKRSLPAGGS